MKFVVFKSTRKFRVSISSQFWFLNMITYSVKSRMARQVLGIELTYWNGFIWLSVLSMYKWFNLFLAHLIKYSLYWMLLYSVKWPVYSIFLSVMKTKKNNPKKNKKWISKTIHGHTLNEHIPSNRNMTFFVTLWVGSTFTFIFISLGCDNFRKLTTPSLFSETMQCSTIGSYWHGIIVLY